MDKAQNKCLIFKWMKLKDSSDSVMLCYTTAVQCGGVLLRHLSLQMDYF